MPYLKVKNELGQWKPIQYIKGAPGDRVISDADNIKIKKTLDARYGLEQKASGINPVLSNPTSDTLYDLKVYGNCIQNGTPTPDVPVEVESVGDLVTSGEHSGSYKVEIRITGDDSIVISSIVIYLKQPLRKVGDNADYIDWENQKVVRNIKEKTFTSADTIYTFSGNNYVTYQISDIRNGANVISNRYTTNTVKSRSYGIQIFDSVNTSSADNWETLVGLWGQTLSPLRVYYALATPTEESITLSSLTLGENNNIISCSTTTQPSDIVAMYYRKTNNVLNEIRQALTALQSET